jgi:hypothetical protein
MLFYRIIPDTMGLGPVVYKGTAADAHAEAKMLANRPEARVELVDVPTDKASLLYHLNHPADHGAFKPEKTWKLSPRGAMVECPNGE